MTQKLQKVVEKLQSLPRDKQDQIARLVLHELKEDAEWESSTRKNAKNAAKLARQVLEDEKSGKTKELDPNVL